MLSMQRCMCPSKMSLLACRMQSDFLENIGAIGLLFVVQEAQTALQSREAAMSEQSAKLAESHAKISNLQVRHKAPPTTSLCSPAHYTIFIHVFITPTIYPCLYLCFRVPCPLSALQDAIKASYKALDSKERDNVLPEASYIVSLHVTSRESPQNPRGWLQRLRELFHAG